MNAAAKVVRGIELAKVDVNVLAENLAQRGVKVPKRADAATLIELYCVWVNGEIDNLPPGVDYGACDNCDASCDPELSVCPVCGKKDGAPDAVIVETGNPTDLDAAVTNIRALLVQSFKKYWELGRALLDCHNSGLYKARLDEKQRPVYRTWDAFAKAELELSGRQAREIMHVAERFTEAQVRKLGVERLKLLARAPEPHRERLLKRAPELSVREVKAEVQAVLGSPTSEKAKKSEVGDPSGEEVVCTFQNAASELPIVSNDGGQTKVATEVLPNVRVKYEVVLGERPVLRITRERASEAKS